MVIQMNWTDATFKGSDVIKGFFLLTSLILLFARMESKLNNVFDGQQEMRQTQVQFIKDYYTDREATRNDINFIKQELRLQNLRIEQLEKKK